MAHRRETPRLDVLIDRDTSSQDPNENGPLQSGPPEEPIVRPGSRPAGKSFGELFPHLFLIPLLLVTVGVLIYLFFIAIAKDTRSVREILSDISSGGEHSRMQDAYALAQVVKEREAKAGPIERFSSEETALLVRILEQFPRDEFLRPYAIKVLGRAGQPAQALPVLKSLLENEDLPADQRAAALQALGFTNEAEAIPILLAELRDLDGPDDWEMRLYAILSLVQVWQNRRDLPVRDLLVEELRRHLSDPRREVAWNTASWLAQYFEDDSGIDLLRRLSDIDFLDEQRGDRGQPLTPSEQEQWMLHAIRALHILEPEALADRLPAIRDTARKEGWAQVLNTVSEYLEEERGGGGPREACLRVERWSRAAAG